MRIWLVLACLVLTACAAPAQRQTFGYKGEFPVSGAHIDSGGGFVARAYAGAPGKIVAARQTAIRRLHAEALARGYHSYVLEDMRVMSQPEPRVVLSGRVFRVGEGPREALPIEGMAHGVVALHDPAAGSFRQPVELAGRRPERRSAPKTSDRAKGDPLVIAAPEFVDE